MMNLDSDGGLKLRRGFSLDIYMSDSVCMIACWDLFTQFMAPKKGISPFCSLSNGRPDIRDTGNSPNVSKNVERFNRVVLIQVETALRSAHLVA